MADRRAAVDGHAAVRRALRSTAPARSAAAVAGFWIRRLVRGGAERGLWAAQLELVSLLEQNEELRTFLAGIQLDAATGLAELFLFLGIDPAQDPESARTAGSVLHAMFIGVMAKWFMDPGQALTARELAGGLQIIAQRMIGKDQ